MSKYYALMIILAALLLQSCSDESKSTDCSQCAQDTQCETCQECQQCPTCKEGDECPACPAPSCPTCPTCKEGDECPACNCKECPECNTDALNSQLTACNNELTTSKQALETEQNANESCVGDLDNCNKDLSELSAKPRSKSGSRLIFKEHKMSDGSIYVEPYPYDTKLDINCKFTKIGDSPLCCFPSDDRTWLLPYSYISWIPSYSNSSCEGDIRNEYYLMYESNETKTLTSCFETGNIYPFTLPNYNQKYTCGIYDSYPIYLLTVEGVSNSPQEFWYKNNTECTSTTKQVIHGHIATEQEIRAYYVCEE